MPRKVQLAGHLSTLELKDRYRKSKDSVESRRWHLLWKVSLGWQLKDSASAVGINYQYSKKILRQYNLEGEEGVKNRKKELGSSKKGRKGLLNEEQLEKLAQALKTNSPDGGIWTGPKVARWMEKETGSEKIANQRGWDYLKKLGYSWQRPRPKHKKAIKDEQETFIKNLPKVVEEIKEKFSGCQVETWFFDEHRIGLKPIYRKVWSLRGERPTAIVSHRYEWLYVYGFVNPKTGETLWYLIPRVNTQWLNKVYESFSRDVGISPNKKILLFQDNAGWHRSQHVRVPEGMAVKFLPAYSPELQPAERLWCLVDEPVVNQYFETIEELESVLIKRCNVLTSLQEEVKNLTHYHWLHFL